MKMLTVFGIECLIESDVMIASLSVSTRCNERMDKKWFHLPAMTILTSKSAASIQSRAFLSSA